MQNVTITVTSDNPSVTVPPPLTFARNNWNTAQTVTVSGAEDDNATNESGVQLRHTVSSGDADYAALTPTAVTVGVTDNDTPGVTVSPTRLAVNEGGPGGEYTLSLDTRPMRAVTITVTSDNAAVTATSPLTFDRNNWNQAQTVTVTGAEDNNVISESGVQLSHTVSSGDADYAALTPIAVTVSVTDNDTPSVRVSQPTLDVTEGGSSDYNLQLGSQPMQNVTITVTSDNPSVTVPPPLTFARNNWNTAQTVTVSGAEDDNATNESGVQLRHTVISADNSYNAIAVSAVNVTVTDNDTPSVRVSPPTLNVTEGGSSDYNLQLGSRPMQNVTITVTSDNPSVTVPPPLTFDRNNWNTAQTVTVSGAEDDNATNESGVQLSHTVRSGDRGYAALTPTAVTVSVTDNDTPSVRVSQPTLNVTEGGSSDYNLQLGSRPMQNVTITVTSDNPSVTVPPPLTFARNNWNTAQTVTVSGAEDDNATNESGVQLRHTVTSADNSYNAIAVSAVNVTVTDNDTPSVRVSPPTLNVTEGGSSDYNLQLGSRPMQNVTITVTSDNPSVTVPPPLTFARNNWNTAQTVTVTGAEDNNEISESGVQLSHTVSSGDADYAGLTPTAVTVSVTDNDTPGVTVSPTRLAVNEGGPGGEYTLSLDTRPMRAVTITVTSDNAAVTATSPLTFDRNNWNQAQTVTVTGAEDINVISESGVQLSHTVRSGDRGYAALTPTAVTVSVTDNDTPSVRVSPPTLNVTEGGSSDYNLQLGSRPMQNVTITVTSDNPSVTVPPPLTFARNNWNTAQTVTVSGAEDDNVISESGVQLSHTVSSGDADYAALTPTAVTVGVTDNDTPVPGVAITRLAVNLDVDGSGGPVNQMDGLMIGRYLFGLRDAAGLFDTTGVSPWLRRVVRDNIARAVASGRLDVDNSGGAANQNDGLIIFRYFVGIRDAGGLLAAIPGNPSFGAVTANIEELLGRRRR